MTAPEAPQTLRRAVLELFAAAGFEVRDNDAMGVFAINGSIDSAALVVEWLTCGGGPVKIELPEA